MASRSGAVATVSPWLHAHFASLVGPERVAYVPPPWPVQPPVDAAERQAARGKLGIASTTSVLVYTGNLDAYQDNVNKHFGTNYKIPILYFTQLMGLAFDIPPKKLGFGKEFISAAPALAKIGHV